MQEIPDTTPLRGNSAEICMSINRALASRRRVSSLLFPRETNRPMDAFYGRLASFGGKSKSDPSVSVTVLAHRRAAIRVATQQMAPIEKRS